MIVADVLNRVWLPVGKKPLPEVIKRPESSSRNTTVEVASESTNYRQTADLARFTDLADYRLSGIPRSRISLSWISIPRSKNQIKGRIMGGWVPESARMSDNVGCWVTFWFGTPERPQSLFQAKPDHVISTFGRISWIFPPRIGSQRPMCKVRSRRPGAGIRIRKVRLF